LHVGNDIDRAVVHSTPYDIGAIVLDGFLLQADSTVGIELEQVRGGIDAVGECLASRRINLDADCHGDSQKRGLDEEPRSEDIFSITQLAPSPLGRRKRRLLLAYNG
jgi:hypothetical protein